MKLFSAAGVFSGVAIHEMERIATARKHWMSYLCPVDAMRIDQNGNEADRTKV